MAYSAVASLLQTIDLLLTHHHHSISPQFENLIISIHQHTRSLRSFVEGSSARVYNWEETIKEVTVRAEDIIELLLSDSLLGTSRSDELERGKCEVHYSFDELEKVREEMESIVKKVTGRRRVGTEDDMDEELMEIVSRLVGGSSSLEIIAICGSSVIGKTTLASKAYSHPSIVGHFDFRLGFAGTREDKLVRVIMVLLRQMKADFSRAVPENELIERLLQTLSDRRYLIWLDDVWSKNVMERLKTVLPDCGNGSRIIFTTGSSELAMESAQHVHEMRLLDANKSWNLLRDKMFKGDPFQLESKGKTIARSCGGHRLSIAVVSGILAADQSEAAWEDVSENIKLASENVDEIVYLSYIYLPHRLRPCLLYLGIYPQGRVISVSWIVRMWAAEGFVDESSGYKSLEETGEGYVEDLVRRSLVSVHTRKCNGGIKCIRVHDLVRGICQRQACIDNFNHQFSSSSKEIIKSSRRMSCSNACGYDFLSGVHGSTIRTLLRVLKLINVYTCYHFLTGQVFELLFHLRYFDLYWEFNIPEAISNLQNLQTLIICHKRVGGIFNELPEGIWRMPQLRHLCVFSFKFPNGKGPSSPLQNLQTLSQAVDFVCSREILEIFPNLKKLALLYTKDWKGVVEDYELQNLIYLRKLEVLKIEMNLSVGEEHRMSCATFPPTLKKLSLRGLQLSWEDMKIFASLPNLEVLKLRNHACIGDTWETSDGGFSWLVFLRIEESNLEKWIMKSSHFPRLRKLVLVRCSSLLEIPYEMAGIPTLRLIYLDDTTHSAQRIQQDRHTFGHDPLHVDGV